VVDAMDRRRLLMVAQVLMAGCSAGLAVNADLGTSLWPLFVLPPWRPGSVSGGLACIAGALVLARLLPGFRKQATPPVNNTAASLLMAGSFVEVAGIEPASFSASPGLLRAQLAALFSAPAIMQARRRQAQSLFDVPPGPATGSGGDPSS
jgi:hypothetical protein